MCRPDISLDFAAFAQHTDPDKANPQILNKAISRCRETKNQAHTLVELDPRTMYMAVFIDAAFANNKDLSSKVGFLTTLLDSS